MRKSGCEAECESVGTSDGGTNTTQLLICTNTNGGGGDSRYVLCLFRKVASVHSPSPNGMNEHNECGETRGRAKRV